jgi:cytochrome d ubiquinol oxidase subunit I
VLWIFGWDRLPKRVHLACIWLASTGTMLSAYFILAANSWMQHPVGNIVNPATGRAELTDFAAVLTNSTAVGAFLHTITACFVTGGMFLVGSRRSIGRATPLPPSADRPARPGTLGCRYRVV